MQKRAFLLVYAVGQCRELHPLLHFKLLRIALRKLLLLGLGWNALLLLLPFHWVG